MFLKFSKSNADKKEAIELLTKEFIKNNHIDSGLFSA